MTIKEKLISHRLDVAFIMFLIILLISSFPLIFIEEDIKWTIIPFIGVLLLILWLVYSAIAQKKLLIDGVISDKSAECIESFMWDFKPNSKIKILFAAYGITVGVFMILSLLIFAISPELLDKLAFSNVVYAIILIVYIASYVIARKKMK